MSVPSISAYMVLADRQRPRSQQLDPGVSDVFGCRRKFCYKLARTEPTDYSTSMPAIIGTAVHSAAEKAVRMFRGPEVLIEHEIEFAGLKGHLDKYENGLVEDLKTVGSYRMKAIKLHGADEQHLAQASIYAKGLMDQGYPVGGIRIAYVSRDDGTGVNFDSPYRADLVEQAEQWIQTQRDTPLEWSPRDHQPTSAYCQNCPFRSACWGGNAPAPREPWGADVVHLDARSDADRLKDVREQLSKLRDEEARLKAALEPYKPEHGGSVDVGSRNYLLRWSPHGKGWRLTFEPKDA